MQRLGSSGPDRPEARGGRAGKDGRVMHVFNAALPIPIRSGLLPESDDVHAAALSFSAAPFVSSAASGAGPFCKFAEKACRLSLLGETLAGDVRLVRTRARMKSFVLVLKGKAAAHALEAALKGVRARESTTTAAALHFPLQSQCARAPRARASRADRARVRVEGRGRAS